MVFCLFLSGCTSSGIYIFSAYFVGEVRESSVLQHPIKGVNVLNEEGEVLGKTDADGRFMVQASAKRGVAQLVFQHPDYEVEMIEQVVDGRKNQTIQLPLLNMRPAGGQITGQVIRKIQIAEGLEKNSFVSHPMNEMIQDAKIIEDEYNLITHKGKEWLIKKIAGKGEILYASDTGFYSIRLNSNINREKWIEELTLSGDVDYIAPNRLVQKDEL